MLIKAVAGGGGKGMRRVERHADFDAALEGATREAASSFGDSRVLIEKYVTAPRHIEMQVFGDQHGNVIHLYERDCSLQRRHQKVIEEAPAPGMTAEVRAAMGRAAANAASAVGYVGAGTVEFIASGAGGLKPGGFWFMEMNTRLQVEHPVTEAITGIDLVEWQFRIAAGEPLPLSQDKVPLNGHAVEARLYAEDPERGFIPSTGRLLALDLPRGEGIRVDTGVETGAEVSPFYDPMIAKVIAHAPSRNAALDRLADALDRTVAVGPRTNVAFLAALARAPGFRGDDFDTGFIERNLDTLGAVPQPLDAAAAAAAVDRLVAQQEERLRAQLRHVDGQAHSPWGVADGFQLSGLRSTTLPVTVDGVIVSAGVAYDAHGRQITVGGVGPAPDALTIDAPGAVVCAAARPPNHRPPGRGGRQRRARQRGRRRARADAWQVACSPCGKGRQRREGPSCRRDRSDEDGAHAHGADRRHRHGNLGNDRQSGCGKRDHHGDRGLRRPSRPTAGLI